MRAMAASLATTMRARAIDQSHIFGDRLAVSEPGAIHLQRAFI
jgi:hypothetical protein